LELLRKAKTAALRAIELDPSIGQAHSALGLALVYTEWDWAGAERETQLGVKLSPNSVQAHDDYRICLWLMGRFDEALDEINKILELDPLSQLYRRYPSGHYYWARRYEESIRELEKLPELREKGGDPLVRQWPLVLLTRNYIAERRDEEALAICEKLRSFLPIGKLNWVDATIACVYGITGRRTEALEIIDHCKKRNNFDPAFIAAMFVSIGERDQAFDWLNIGYEKRSPEMVWLKNEPFLDPIRDDPHFQDLLRRMNFPK
jgi:tetratricopeptide (TPR) repeat protein